MSNEDLNNNQDLVETATNEDVIKSGFDLIDQVTSALKEHEATNNLIEVAAEQMKKGVSDLNNKYGSMFEQLMKYTPAEMIKMTKFGAHYNGILSVNKNMTEEENELANKIEIDEDYQEFKKYMENKYGELFK